MLKAGMRNIASMFNLTIKEFWITAAFIVILASIPFSFLLLRETQIFKSQATEQRFPQRTATTSANLTGGQEVPKTSPLAELQKLLGGTPQPATAPAKTPAITPTPTLTVSLGPTLTVKIKMEGKPANKQGGAVFIGIGLGNPTQKPTYLLSYNVTFPNSGVFSGISLAGLNAGVTYTAYLKGPSHIDTGVAFIMSPTETILNNNFPVELISGDLNEDNTINTTDYSIVKSLFGTTSTSSNWSSKADLNGDGVINSLDLSLIVKNLGKTGTTGLWSSPAPITPTATPSGGLQTEEVGGYWVWVPEI